MDRACVRPMSNKADQQIIFPALKEVARLVSGERCATVSTYITSLIVDNALTDEEVLPDDSTTQD